MLLEAIMCFFSSFLNIGVQVKVSRPLLVKFPKLFSLERSVSPSAIGMDFHKVLHRRLCSPDDDLGDPLTYPPLSSWGWQLFDSHDIWYRGTTLWRRWILSDLLLYDRKPEKQMTFLVSLALCFVLVSKFYHARSRAATKNYFHSWLICRLFDLLIY